MFKLEGYSLLRGQDASHGIGMGKAYIYEEVNLEIPQDYEKSPEEGILDFRRSHEQAVKEIDDIYKTAKETLSEEEAEIFGAHKMMLTDSEYMEAVEVKISEGLHPAQAVEEVKGYFVGVFQGLDNPYFRERALDVADVSDRLIRILLGIEEKNLTELPEHTILVAKDLTPSDTMRMDKKHVAGFVMEQGGLTSHTAIIARTLSIPAVIGVEGALDCISHDEELIIDGVEGIILLDSDQEAREHYGQMQEKLYQEEQMLQKYLGRLAETKDHKKCLTYANIGSVDDLPIVLGQDAQGIGLFRTEFLYMGRDTAPSEEEQYSVYREVAEKMASKEVTIRTLDVGGDKQIPYLNMGQEANPFLGYRAIRYCLDHTELFKTQLRAICRASAYGKLLIMFPMIAAYEELIDAKELLRQVQEELRHEEISFDPDMKIGMMIETPASVLLADQFAQEVDFFSIGSNDLIQYTMVADRMNRQVENLYSPYYPAIIRAIYQVTQAAKKHKVTVSICGEVANDRKLTALWLRMGIQKLSVIPSAILRLRHHICQLSTEDVSIEAILSASTLEKIQGLLSNEIKA